jgi:hypothetical protein
MPGLQCLIAMTRMNKPLPYTPAVFLRPCVPRLGREHLTAYHFGQSLSASLALANDGACGSSLVLGISSSLSLRPA